MLKFVVPLLILLSLIIMLKGTDIFLKKITKIKQKIQTIIIFERKYKIECKLSNEIIDRSNRDLERQCYYECDENDIVRVDTSIEYICQPFIVGEKMIKSLIFIFIIF